MRKAGASSSTNYHRSRMQMKINIIYKEIILGGEAEQLKIK